MVSKRMLELHPLYSPSKLFVVGDKRSRSDDDLVAVELDDVESMIREEVLMQLQGKKQLCACGELIELVNSCFCLIGCEIYFFCKGDMFNAHVLPCPHCGSQKCSDCTALALEVGKAVLICHFKLICLFRSELSHPVVSLVLWLARRVYAN
jgi:hypothetical protein